MTIRGTGWWVILIRSITLRDGAKPTPNKKPRRSGAGSLSAASIDVKLIGLASAGGSFMTPNFCGSCVFLRDELRDVTFLPWRAETACIPRLALTAHRKYSR